MECLFLTDQCLFIFVFHFTLLVPASDPCFHGLFVHCLNKTCISRRWQRLSCFGVSSVLPWRPSPPPTPQQLSTCWDTCEAVASWCFCELPCPALLLWTEWRGGAWHRHHSHPGLPGAGWQFQAQHPPGNLGVLPLMGALSEA